MLPARGIQIFFWRLGSAPRISAINCSMASTLSSGASRITDVLPLRSVLWLNEAMRVFDHLSPDLRERLVHLATELHVPAGHTLIRRGERSDDIPRLARSS